MARGLRAGVARPTRPHKAEFHQRDQGISVRVDVAVAPADDVEVRQITLHNETDRTRQLTRDQRRRARAPARWARRRPTRRSPGCSSRASSWPTSTASSSRAARGRAATSRAVLVHRLVRESAAVTFAGYETDRGGLLRSLRERARSEGAGDSGHDRFAAGSGAVLDPVMSLMARVELKPNRTVTLAFVTSVGRTRSAALDLARRYGSMHAVRWAFRDAEHESGRRIARAQARARAPARRAAALLRAPLRRSDAARPARGRSPPRARASVACGREASRATIRSCSCASTTQRRRSCGRASPRSATCDRAAMRLDLVLVDEQASGYVTGGAGTLRSVLAAADVDEWLNRHGGIFVLAADQLQGDERAPPRGERARRARYARPAPSTLASARPAERPPKLPPFGPTLADEGAPRAPPRPRLLFDNGLGGFTEDGARVRDLGAPRPAHARAVVQRPGESELRLPGERVVARLDLVAQRGENRLTPWRNDPVFDTPVRGLVPAGRRDRGGVVADAAARRGATPRRSSATARATRPTRARAHGLWQELTIFVPPDAPLKIARLKLRNTLARHRQADRDVLRRVGSGEPARGAAAVHRERARRGRRVSPGDDAAGTPTSASASRSSRRRCTVHGFTTDRTEFLGRRGDCARPEALERWGLAGSVDSGVDPCAARAGAPRAGSGRGDRDALRARPGGKPRRGARAASRASGMRAAVESAWKETERVLGRAARERARQDAGAGDGPHAQPVAALPDPLVALLRTNGASISRAGPSGIATSSRTSWRSSTRRPSARARTSSKRRGTSSRRATSCTGGIRRRAAACGRAAPTTWRGCPSSRPSTSWRRATRRSSPSRCPS